MEVREVPVFSSADAAALADGEEDPYGTDGLGLSWRPKDHHVVVSEHGRVIGHAGFLPIEVETANGRREGVGLGSVLVHRSFRGRGTGERLVRETAARMRAMDRSFGLLFCRDVRLAFYEHLGWRRIPGEVTVDQEEGPIVMPLLTCWLPFDDAEGQPPDSVRLLGLPF